MIVTTDNFGCSTPIDGSYFSVGAAGSYAPELSVGAVLQFFAEFTTDNVTTGGATDPPPTGTFYVKEGLWLPAGSATEPLTSPGSPFFIMDWNASTPMGSWEPLAFSGSQPQENGVLLCWLERTEDTSGNFVLHFKLAGFVAMTADLSGYLNTNLTNRKRFLFNEGGATTELANTASSVYRQQRTFRLAMWFALAEPTMGNPNLVNWYSLKADLAQKHKWYDRDALDAAATTLNTPVWEFERNSVAVGNLSATEDTFVTFKFQASAPGMVCVMHAWSFKSNPVPNSSTFILDGAASYVRVVTDVGSGTLPSSYGELNPGTTPLWSPSTEATEVAAGEWEATFRVRSTLLTAGAAYRIVAVIYYETDPGEYDSYSFISPELQTNALPALCQPVAIGKITDYWKDFIDWLNVSPQERLRNSVTFEAAAYDACRSAGAMLDGVLSVTLTGFKQAGNLKHVVVLGSANRNALGVWSSQLDGLEISQDYGANTLSMSYDYRVRYEANLPNVVSYNGVALMPSPLSNQDWVGQTIYWEWRVRVQVNGANGIFYDELVYRQRIDVHGYDEECLQVEVSTIAGVLHRLCDSVGTFQFCAVNCVENEDKAIFGIDRFPYSIEQFDEYEDWTGILDQLQEAPIISADEEFEAADDFTACATVDATQLELDALYRMVIIRKQDSSLCGSTGASGGGDDSGLISQPIGGSSGRVYVVGNAYGAPDTFELYYDGNLEDTTGGLVSYIAVLQYDYVAAFGQPQTVDVRVFGGGTGTGWDFFVFCPDFLPACNAQYEQLLDLCLPSGCGGLGTCGTRSFFYIFPLGTTAGEAWIDITHLASAFPLTEFNVWVTYMGVTALVNLATPDTALNTCTFVAQPTAGVGTVTSFPLTWDGLGDDFIFVTVATNTGMFPTCSPFSPRPFTVSVRCTDFEPDEGGVAQVGNVNIYTYPMPNASQDNATITRLLQVPRRKLCTLDLLADPCDGFNFHRCGNDKEYFQPFVPGDLLYFQFNAPDFVNTHPVYTAGWVADPGAVPIDEWLASVEVQPHIGCGAAPSFEAFAQSSYVGGDDNENSFQGIVIDTTNMPDRFHLKFTFNSPNGEVYGYTEPYQKAVCEQTVLLEGVNPLKGDGATDCDGRYYGELTAFGGQFFVYRNIYRVWGNIEWQNFQIDTEEVGNIATIKKRKRLYLLRIIPSPVYVVQRVETLLMAQKFYVENEELVLKGEVPKKLIANSTWAMNIKLEARLGCDEKDFTCG